MSAWALGHREYVLFEDVYIVASTVSPSSHWLQSVVAATSFIYSLRAPISSRMIPNVAEPKKCKYLGRWLHNGILPRKPIIAFLSRPIKGSIHQSRAGYLSSPFLASAVPG